MFFTCAKSQRVVSAGLGLEVSKNEITSMSLADIITRVVYEPSFREAARRVCVVPVVVCFLNLTFNRVFAVYF